MSGKLVKKLAKLIMAAAIAVTAVPLAAGSVSAADASTPMGIGVFEEDALSYSGAWSPASSDQYYGGGAMVSDQADATVTIYFNGKNPKLYANKGPAAGKMEIRVDGSSQGVIDLYSSVPQNKFLIWNGNNYSSGVHTIQLINKGEKQPGSTSTQVNIDRFENVLSVPSGAAAASGENKVTLTWSPVYQADSYNVFRKGLLDSDYVKINTAPIIGTSYVDTTALNSRSYRYQIQAATNSGFVSSLSSYVTGYGSNLAGMYEESSSAVTLVGNWTGSLGDDHSGGLERYTSSAGGYAEFRFSGTAFRVTSRTGSIGGIAEVLIDGVPAGEIDYYSSTAKYIQPVFDKTGLEDKAHVVVIRYTGRKNAASLGTTIYVDRFEARSELTEPTHLTATTSEAFVRLGWNETPVAEGYNVYRSESSGSGYIKLNTALVKVPNYRDETVVNGRTYYYVVKAAYASAESGSSNEVTVPMNPTSYGTGFHGNRTPAVIYRGLWNGSGGDNEPLSYRNSDNPANEAAFHFEGTAIRLVGRTNTYFGIADIYLDGVKVGQADYYSPTDKYNAKVFERTGLPNGKHTIRVAPTGTKRAESNGASITIQRFEVNDGAPVPTGLGVTVGTINISLKWNEAPVVDGYNVYRSVAGTNNFVKLNSQPVMGLTYVDWSVAAATNYEYKITSVNDTVGESAASTPVAASFDPTRVEPGLHEDNSPSVLYDGMGWVNFSNASSSGGSAKYTSNPGSATLHFNGSGVSITGVKDPQGGIADIYLDGVYQDEADTYNSSRLFKQVFFEKSNLTDGPHSIRIERTPRKNPASFGNYLYLDRFEITRGLPAPTGVAATSQATRIDLGWNEVPLADSYNIYRGTSADGSFTKLNVAPVTTNAFADKFVANGTTYYYKVRTVRGGQESADSAAASLLYNRPSVGPGIYEENDPAFIYEGIRWQNGVNGESFKFSDTAGDSVTLHFTGSQVTLRGLQSPTFAGIAEVYLDGVKVEEITGYGTTTVQNKILFARAELEDRKHTLKIVHSGRKSSSSVDYAIISLSKVEVGSNAPASPTVTATSSDAKVTLSWNAVAPELAYNVYRSTTSGTDYVKLNSAPLTETGYTDTAVTNGTTYYYVVRSVTGTGLESENSRETSARPLPPIGAPTGLQAVPGNNRATLTWTPGAENVGYNLYLSVNSGSGYWKANTAGPITETSFTHTGLSNGTTYYFIVKGIDTFGQESAASNEVSVKPKAPATPPTGLKAAAGDGSVTLSWNAGVDNTGYYVYRSLSAGSGYERLNAAPITARTYVDSAITNGTTYYYVVKAVDSGSQETGASNEASVTPNPAVGAPTGLTAAAGDASVSLTWTAGENNAGYNVYRSLSTGSGFEKLNAALLTDAAYTDTTAKNNTTYYYIVKGVGTGGQESSASNMVSATPRLTTTAPSALSAQAGDGSVALNWTAGQANTGYNVYRSTTSGAGYTKLNDAALTATTYTDNTAVNGTTYYYVVKGLVAGGGETAASNEASATPLAIVTAPAGLKAAAGDSSVSLTWTAGNNNAGYNIYRSTTSGAGYSKLNASPVAQASYTDATAVNGTTYYYVVKGVDAGGQETAATNEASATPYETATPPSGLSAQPGSSSVSLTWTAGQANNGFNVYRSTMSGSGYVKLNVAVVTATAYTDTTAVNGTTYYYVVKAIGPNGQETAASGEVSATPQAVLGVPSNLTAAVQSGQIRLTWTAGSGNFRYNVYRSETPGSGYVKINPDGTALTQTAYADATATPGKTYYYVVKGVGTLGQESAASNEASASIPFSAPTGLNAEVFPSSIKLNWTAGAGNTGYNIYRSTTSGTGYMKLNAATVSQVTYTDASPAYGVTYFYIVKGIGSDGRETAASQEISAKLPVDAVAPVTTYKFTPVMSPDGKYVTALSAALTATDTGSGVLRTEYRINKTGAWITYSGPFTVPAATTKYVEWRSIDKAGNQERVWLMDFTKGTLTQQP